MGSHIPMLLLRFQPSGGGWRGYKPRKAATLGDFNYFYSYMSQSKSQLEMFKFWARKDSDISYYLNSHHVDICDVLVSRYGWRAKEGKWI